MLKLIVTKVSMFEVVLKQQKEKKSMQKRYLAFNSICKSRDKKRKRRYKNQHTRKRLAESSKLRFEV